MTTAESTVSPTTDLSDPDTLASQPAELDQPVEDASKEFNSAYDGAQAALDALGFKDFATEKMELVKLVVSSPGALVRYDLEYTWLRSLMGDSHRSLFIGISTEALLFFYGEGAFKKFIGRHFSVGESLLIGVDALSALHNARLDALLNLPLYTNGMKAVHAGGAVPSAVNPSDI